MFAWDPEAYGPACGTLLADVETCPLGPGTPDMSRRQALAALDVRAITAGQTPRDRDMATCCVSGLWLLHNFLEESHTISQGIPSQTGSYWHGLMHRREPDYSNARYWFRRVGKHPVFPRVCRETRQLAGTSPVTDVTRFLADQPAWDPFRFIELHEAVIGSGSPEEQLCRHVAQLEWRILFDFCFRQAIGTAADAEA